MALSLFGHGSPWQGLLSDQPVVSGRHPLHLYHGFLGARALRDHGTPCCYDPAFQAGYPKTPVFDSGCRMAELFLTLAGGGYQPAAYKVGLVVCCLAVPVLLVAASRGVGLGLGTTCLAVLAGLLVCWGSPGRSALEAGDIDLWMAALAALAQFGLLVRFDRSPRLTSWVGIFLAGCLGWLANPLLLAALVPLVLVYYLSVGTRHRSLTWHGALLAALAGGLAVNAFWLVDWVRNWWIRAPLPVVDSLLPHRTFQTVWNAPLWGDQVDRALILVLIGGALAGVWVLNQSNRRPAARVLGLGAGGLLALAVLGIASESLGRLGTSRLLVPALWFASLPAAHALAGGLALAGQRLGGPGRVAVLAGALLAAVAVINPGAVATFAARSARARPLAIGLGAEREDLVDRLTSLTGTEARVLWEDRPGSATEPRWTPLLPLLTGRSFLGGLDPEAGIEHNHASFADQELAGRHILHWSDDQLDDFCRRYNVGWVVCWSPAVRDRFRAWKAAGPPTRLADGGGGWVFPLRRDCSFALKGQARLVHAGWRHITLADLVPEDGKVVLSLHHQAGLRASPSRVQVERETDPHDPIAFVRLRVSGPVARVTLTWEER
jgi:hypothetical protein